MFIETEPKSHETLLRMYTTELERQRTAAELKAARLRDFYTLAVSAFVCGATMLAIAMYILTGTAVTEASKNAWTQESAGRPYSRAYRP